VADAPRDAVADAPDAVLDPATVVPCGSVDCVIATHYCCFAGSGETCVAIGSACGGTSVECNDTRDCFGVTTCCYDDANDVADCRGGLTCGGGRVRVCDPDLADQCPALTACIRPDGGPRGYGTCR